MCRELLENARQVARASIASPSPMRPRQGSSTLLSNFLTEPVLVERAPPWASFEQQRETGHLQREEIDRRLSCLVETVAARRDSLPTTPWKTALLRWSVTCSHDDVRALIDGFSASPFPDRGVIVAMLEHVLTIETASRAANSSPPPDVESKFSSDKRAPDATPAAAATRTGRSSERERRSGRRSSSVPNLKPRTPPISPPKTKSPDSHLPPHARPTTAVSRSVRPHERRPRP